MSAAEEFLSQAFPVSGTADCVAFVSDNQTLEVVANAARNFFSDPLVRDGGSSEALQYLSEAGQPKVVNTLRRFGRESAPNPHKAAAAIGKIFT